MGSKKLPNHPFLTTANYWEIAAAVALVFALLCLCCYCRGRTAAAPPACSSSSASTQEATLDDDDDNDPAGGSTTTATTSSTDDGDIHLATPSPANASTPATRLRFATTPSTWGSSLREDEPNSPTPPVARGFHLHRSHFAAPSTAGGLYDAPATNDTTPAATSLRFVSPSTRGSLSVSEDEPSSSAPVARGLHLAAPSNGGRLDDAPATTTTAAIAGAMWDAWGRIRDAVAAWFGLAAPAPEPEDDEVIEIFVEEPATRVRAGVISVRGGQATMLPA